MFVMNLYAVLSAVDTYAIGGVQLPRHIVEHHIYGDRKSVV